MKNISLVQLPYLYARNGKTENGNVALPTPILTVASRLHAAGLEHAFIDANRTPYSYDNADVIMLNLHGSPYIPDVIAFEQRIRDEARRAGKEVSFILGGEIASRLTREQFVRLFGHDTINGNDDVTLAAALDVQARDLLPAEEVSLIPVYERLGDEELLFYLSRNLSFFLAQGCKFSCTFCSAKRTRRNPETGQLTVQRESYKNIGLIEAELDYLVRRASKGGLKKLIFYLSNLDLFQTPSALSEFAKCVLAIRKQHEHFTLDIRGLATVDSFLKLEKTQPRIIEDLVHAGLGRVAFGVDGITPAVWKKIGKSHNFSGFDEKEKDSKARLAIHLAREHGITAELLMLFGHNGADTEASMQYAISFTREMMDVYHAIPRSFIAKDIVPGTEAWYDSKNKHVVETFIEHPRLFQALDYLAIASPLTHPDEHFRHLTNRFFLANANLAALTKGDKPLYSTLLRDDGKGVERYYGGFYNELKRLNPTEIG
jgi:hypothetical protein